ncbi:MAG: response regulator transcription factor [Candidatus Gracilibacteria bacterium]
MKILLIEDIQEVATPLIRYLALEDISVIWRSNAREGIYELAQEKFDIIILDLGLPDRDGRDVCGEIRNNGYTIPILVLTSRSRTVDKIELLNIGADDYMVKPVDYDELIARGRALVRRDMDHKSQEITFGNIYINTMSKCVKYCGHVIDLSPREFHLLSALVVQSKQVHSRDSLLEQVWGERSGSGDPKVVDVYIGYLRKKLSRESIETVKGFGYRITNR